MSLNCVHDILPTIFLISILLYINIFLHIFQITCPRARKIWINTCALIFIMKISVLHVEVHFFPPDWTRYAYYILKLASCPHLVPISFWNPSCNLFKEKSGHFWLLFILHKFALSCGKNALLGKTLVSV